jgi:hypothetical protein
MNRKREFRTWFDGEYIYGEYKLSVLNIVSEYIMFHVLNMNYCWAYTRGFGFTKVYDIDYLMK